jgi:hypothetical protein
MRFTWLFALLAVLPAAAQNIPRGSYAWWDSPVVNDLNLSPAQKQRVHETVREFRGQLIDLRAAIQKADLDVEDAFNDETFDARRAHEAVSRLLAARADLGKTLAELSMRLRTILSAEQWHELMKRRPLNQKQGLMRGPARPAPARRSPASGANAG